MEHSANTTGFLNTGNQHVNQYSGASSKLQIAEPTFLHEKKPLAIHHIPHVKTERKNKRFLKDFTKSKPDNKKKRFRQASELGLFM